MDASRAASAIYGQDLTGTEDETYCNNEYGGNTRKPGPSYKRRHHRVHFSKCKRTLAYEYALRQIKEKKKCRHPASKLEIASYMRDVQDTSCTCQDSITSTSCSHSGKCSKKCRCLWKASGAWRDSGPSDILKLLLKRCLQLGGTSIFDVNRVDFERSTFFEKKHNKGVSKEEFLSLLESMRKVTRMAEHQKKTPFIDAIDRQALKQPLVNQKTGDKYNNMKELLDCAVKVFEELYNGLTPLMTAVMYGGTVETMKQIIELDPKAISIKSTIGWTCMHCITSDTPLSAIRYLLSVKYIEDTYTDGETGQSKYKYFDATNAFDFKGRLPIHHAAHEGNVGAFLALYFQNKRSLNTKTRLKCGIDNTRKTPLEIAVSRKENGIITVCKRIKDGDASVTIETFVSGLGELHEHLKPSSCPVCVCEGKKNTSFAEQASDKINALDSDSAGRYITKRYHRSPFKCLSKSSLELPPLVAVEDENPEEIHSSESKIIWGVEHYTKLIDNDVELKRDGYLPKDLYKEHAMLSQEDQVKVLRVLLEMK